MSRGNLGHGRDLALSSDIVVVGGGIVGLATALALTERAPGVSVTLIEKEPDVAQHQTGRNSGVLHSGIYYSPGSLKATLCRSGRQSMIEFCERNEIAFEVCGKLIVATEAEELPGLERLAERGRANGITVENLGPEGARNIEPEVNAIAALWLPDTGIVDYRAVSERMSSILRERGVSLRFNERVVGLQEERHGQVVTTETDQYRARFVVNCAGLQSDRVAKMAGADPGARIVPFRGEYFELTPEATHLVRGLIYPVPDPAFPFLGVHLTRGIDGGVHAGPNAVPSLAREGYRKRDVSYKDIRESLMYMGFVRLARKHARAGSAEILRSLSKARFVRSVQRLMPAIQSEHLRPAPAGVRAQALTPSGALVDDFLLVSRPQSLHVCNAPSPAATSSIEIGRVIASKVPDAVLGL